MTPLKNLRRRVAAILERSDEEIAREWRLFGIARILAEIAETDRRTARGILAGKPTKGHARKRLERAAEALGIPLPYLGTQIVRPPE